MSYFEVHVTVHQDGNHEVLRDLMRPRGWWASKFDLDGDEDAKGKVFYTNQFDTQERAMRACHYFAGVATGIGLKVLRAKVELAVYDTQSLDHSDHVGVDGAV